MIHLYKLLYSAKDGQEMVKSFKEDCVLLGTTKYREGIGYEDMGNLDSYLAKLY